MGRKRHASFRTKSNGKFTQKKIEENNKGLIRKHEEKEEDECGNLEKEEKKKKGLWCKWLDFVRAYWNLKRNRSKDSYVTSLHPSGMSGEKTNQVPPGLEQESPKMFIRATDTKAKSIQWEEISPVPQKNKKKKKKSEGSLVELKKEENGANERRVEIEKTKGDWGVNEQDGKTTECHFQGILSRKREFLEGTSSSASSSRSKCSWGQKAKNEEEDAMTRKFENILTSELYIRKDMDKVVESAAFIEPDLQSQGVESQKSSDTGSKSKRHMSCKMVEDDGCMGTVKTISEPTWSEKRKIFRQQRLQEKINSLLEQFMFIESEDFIGFEKKIVKEKKRVQFETPASSPLEGNDFRELSREVSPEILVNIKPFKEYLSGDYLQLEPTDAIILRKQIIVDQRVSKKKSKEKGKTKNKEDPEKEKIAENLSFHCPVVRSKFHFSRTTHRLDSKEDFGSEEQGHSMQKETEESSSSKLDGLEKVPQGRVVVAESGEPAGICAAWGFYRDYQEPEDLAPKREEKKRFDIDEVVESLDNKDHDRIFRKNLAQFRKKINVPPHFELRNPGHQMKIRGLEKKKFRRQENKFEIVNRKPESQALVALVGSHAPWERIRNCDKSTVADIRKLNEKHIRQPEKILENYFLVLSQRNIVRTALGTRIESQAVRSPQTLREIYPVLEKNVCVLVEKELPGAVDDVAQVSDVFLPFSLNFPASQFEKIARFMSTSDFGYEINDCDCFLLNVVGSSNFMQSNFLTNPTECFYMVENFLFSDPDETDFPGMSSGLSSDDLETDEEVKSERKSAVVIEIFQEARGVIQMLQDARWEMMVWTENVQLISQQPPDEIASVEGTKVTEILRDEGVGHDCVEFPKNDFVEKAENDSSDTECDGFQVLYDGMDKNINDEDEDPRRVNSTKSVFSNGSAGSDLKPEMKEGHCDSRFEEGDISTSKGIDSKKKLEDPLTKDPIDVTVSKSTEKEIVARLLKYKSISSPRETIVGSEGVSQDQRLRRSVNSSKEMEKDFHGCKKKRISVDKGVEMRRTGSAFFETRVPKLTLERSFGSSEQNKVSADMENQLKNVFLQESLKTEYGKMAATNGTDANEGVYLFRMAMKDKDASLVEMSDGKYLEGTKETRKMLVFEKNGSVDSEGPNVRKEVLAAFNCIKDISSRSEDLGGKSKKVSLVIMLSRK